MVPVLRNWLLVLIVFPPLVVAAPDGEALYAQHCAVCHGDSGNGGVGVPLALPSFLSSVDDGFLRKTIRLGRPGRVMPAFPKLSDAQLDAIVAFVRSWSKKEAPQFPSSRIEGNPQHGKELYARYCAQCHGLEGRGGKGTGVTFSRRRSLPIIAPALNNPGFLAAASDHLIKQTLELGREGTPMGSYLVQGLSGQDIDDLVSFVRSYEHAVDDSVQVQPGEATIRVQSPYDLEETIENLKQAITDQNFTLIREEPLEHGLVAEGEEQGKSIVLHFCNFRFLYEALAIDPRVGIFLPCRVTVTEHAGQVEVMAVNPLTLSGLFNNRELDNACKQMHGIYTSIIEDATL